MHGTESDNQAQRPVASHRGSDAVRVLNALEELCDTLRPGARIPTHTELMRRFQASERTVLRALQEMQQKGRIFRRRGSGTYVSPVRTGASAAEVALPLLSAAPLVPAVFSPGIEKTPGTIVVVTLTGRSFFDRCMDLLHWYAEAADLSVVCQTLSPDTGPVLPSAAAAQDALGFLVFGYDLVSVARQLQDGGARVVVVGVPPAGVQPDIPCVYSDHEQGGYLATRHLIELGHRRIAFFRASDDLRRRLRWKGYQNALQEAEKEGVSAEGTLLAREVVEDWKEDPTRAAAFFRTSGAPTALVAWNDHEAMQLLWTLMRAGIRVPEDVSLVGYDALPESRHVHPPLTTVDHEMGQQINSAMDLLRQADPLLPTQTIVTTPTLIRRESTAPPPA